MLRVDRFNVTNYWQFVQVCVFHSMYDFGDFTEFLYSTPSHIFRSVPSELSFSWLSGVYAEDLRFSAVIVFDLGWSVSWNCIFLVSKKKFTNSIEFIFQIYCANYFYIRDFSDKSYETNISFSLLTEGVDQWWELRVRKGILWFHLNIKCWLLCLLNGKWNFQRFSFLFCGQRVPSILCICLHRSTGERYRSRKTAILK